MKIAMIDMGSNSIRLMLATIEDKTLIHVEKKLEMTRLGSAVDKTKCLSEDSMAATIAALLKFKRMAEEDGYQLMGAFATSAVRDANNGQAFTERVLNETGIVVNILSGDEEAHLGYLGVQVGLLPEWMNETFVIIDIGGGSTEIIIGSGEEVLWRYSFNIGAVRMTGKHLHSDPASPEEIERLRIDIQNILSSKLNDMNGYMPMRAIGIGGTATTFAAMMLEMAIYDREKIHNAFVAKEVLESTVNQLAQLTTLEKRQLKGLQPKRADIIQAGGEILLLLLNVFNLEGFYASDFDNLEGLLAEKKII